METRSAVARLEMMYSPGDNSASFCTRAFASARLCASSTKSRVLSVRNLKGGKGQTHPNSVLWGRLGRQLAITASIWCVGVVAGDQRGLLSSDVISEHDLHPFARKLLQKTFDFLDVPPVHLRGVHETGFPVPLNLEGHGFAARGYLRPTVNQKTLRCLRRPLLLMATARYISG